MLGMPSLWGTACTTIVRLYYLLFRMPATTENNVMPNISRIRNSFATPLFVLLTMLLLPVLVCSSANALEEDRKVVVCSTTQVADFAREIVGDRWEVVCVLSPGEDPHTYELAGDDKQVVQRADLCAENGWNLEGHDWMKKLATEAGKPIVTCIEGVSPLQMEEGEETVKDPHAWLDPKNAEIYVNNLCEAICGIDPPHAAEYRARRALYVDQLRMLRRWIGKTVNSLPANQRLLVTHHDAFEYFCKAYNFQTASPLGWTTADMSEVTAVDRQKIVKKIRELGVKAIFVETSTNNELIEGIAADSGVKVGGELYADAMGPKGSAGEYYIGMMRENVLTIVNALN